MDGWRRRNKKSKARKRWRQRERVASESERALVASRAMVYGLARMAADGHFPEWQLPQTDTPATLHGVLDFFIASLAQRARDG